MLLDTITLIETVRLWLKNGNGDQWNITKTSETNHASRNRRFMTELPYRAARKG